ncbi:DDB1- and CUL4-associated factor 4 [Entomophthora muscae]|uniref:DDB1- and CUL4-associated factor 4 n=1 Tax=Entomophthora muscae TaxID=34485 RepID=A0ACC2UHH6_9FUNG|nr:DDB1- and CUL4-associated factor 4 [Entomophthora muscae]
MYHPAHSSPALQECKTSSAVLSASFLPQPDTLHLGCRNGTVLSYDLRAPHLRQQRFKRNDSLAIYRILNYTPNYLITAELGGKIAQWDIRHESKPVQLFSGFRNSCDFNLGVAIHDLSATLTAAGDDNMVHHWSLSTGHEVSNPQGPFETTVSHIVPFSQDTFRPSNAEASSSALQDGYLMMYGTQMDIWTW